MRVFVCLRESKPESVPGLSHAIPAPVPAAGGLALAQGHRELKPELLHLLQLTGDIRHLHTHTHIRNTLTNTHTDVEIRNTRTHTHLHLQLDSISRAGSVMQDCDAPPLPLFSA